MQNVRLDESPVGIKISRRNINNLRCADHTTLMAEREELKSLLKKVKEEIEKARLRLSIQKTKIMASNHLMAIHGEKVEVVIYFVFLGYKITADSD